MLMLMLAFVLVAPLVPYALAYMGPGNNPNPGADLWREIRQREATPPGAAPGISPGVTQVQGVDSAVLINKPGEDWRLFRMERLVPIGAWVLGGMLAVITVFYIMRGRVMIEGGRSGMVVERFSVAQRIVHWFIASLFVLLGVTGLVLLYGRFVLIPLLGPEGFSATASACKEAHNLFGPLFPFAVLAVIVHYGRGNAFRLVDLKWFLHGGGLFSKHGHAGSEKYNGGQKVWFWMIVILGTVISISGLVLDFAVFGQGRQVMALAHVSHGVLAILMIAVAFGHIYIGSVGMEGALESMTTGEVDVNWAREHHDLWLAEMEKAGKVRPAGAELPGGEKATEPA
jgi:formate dehydrogenase subunit gamma